MTINFGIEIREIFTNFKSMKTIALLLIFFFSINAQDTTDDKITYIFVNYTMQTIKVKPVEFTPTDNDSVPSNIEYWEAFKLSPGALKKVTIRKKDLKYLTSLKNLNFTYKPKKRISVSYEQMLITFQPGF